MKPLIRETQDKKYIEIIGHYDNPILCAKLTVLADLYAVEHKEGYALFKVEDYDKLSFIDDKLEFAGDILPPASLSDLTGTTWLFKDTISTIMPGGTDFDAFNDSDETYDLNFQTDSSHTYTKLVMADKDYNDYFGNHSISYAQNNVSNYTGAFTFTNYSTGAGTWETGTQTITITGGADATNASLIAWLSQNATQVIISKKILKLGNKIINKINNKKIKSFNGIDVMCGKTS